MPRGCFNAYLRAITPGRMVRKQTRWHHEEERLKPLFFVLRCISTKYGVCLFMPYTYLGYFGATESVQIEYYLGSRKIAHCFPRVTTTSMGLAQFWQCSCRLIGELRHETER